MDNEPGLSEESIERYIKNEVKKAQIKIKKQQEWRGK